MIYTPHSVSATLVRLEGPMLRSAIAKVKVGICDLVVVVLLFASTTSAFERTATLSCDDPQNVPIYDLTPNTGVQGGEYTVEVIRREPGKGGITETTVLSPPKGIKVSDTRKTSNASLTAKISVSKETSL